jgi:putative transposase
LPTRSWYAWSGRDGFSEENAAFIFSTEVIRQRGPWNDLEAVEHATLEWVHWFNNTRRLKPIGNVPSEEFEMAYYAEQDIQALGAGLS